MSRISAGVWGQSAAPNSLSMGKYICHICLVGKTKNQMALQDEIASTFVDQ